MAEILLRRVKNQAFCSAKEDAPAAAVVTGFENSMGDLDPEPSPPPRIRKLITMGVKDSREGAHGQPPEGGKSFAGENADSPGDATGAPFSDNQGSAAAENLDGGERDFDGREESLDGGEKDLNGGEEDLNGGEEDIDGGE